MKKSIIATSVIASCITICFLMTSFTKIPSASIAHASGGGAVTFFASSPPDQLGPVYTGPVDASGAINAIGTFVMPTEVHGMALHCVFDCTFPNGTITIRMNCNMVTFNGRWKVLGGTGKYSNLKGEGTLIMPNATDEVLTGVVSGL